MLAVLALVGAGFMLARAGASVEPSRPPAGRRTSCDVSILLVGTGRSPASRVIDDTTGSRGWSHAAVDGCEVDERGIPMGLDCTPGYGVRRRPVAEIVEGRPVARIHLPLRYAGEFYGCVRGRVGAPFDVLGLFRGATRARAGYVCSQLVYECLPDELQRRVAVPRGRAVAPNDLARAFGVRGPGDWWVQE